MLAAGCDGRCATRGAVCGRVQHPVAAAGDTAQGTEYRQRERRAVPTRLHCRPCHPLGVGDRASGRGIGDGAGRRDADGSGRADRHVVIAPGRANATAPQEGSSAGAAAFVHTLDCTVRELPVERDPNDLIRPCDRAFAAADFRLAALRARLQ